MSGAEGGPAAALGLHHVTTVSGRPQTNLGFNRRALGLKLVKRTVNHDEPEHHHFYYGDAIGAPGSLLTAFAGDGLAAGRPGAGQATLTEFEAPLGALDFWERRLPGFGARLVARETRFGEERIVFTDPEGLLLAVTAVAPPPPGAAGAPGAEIGPEHALRGLRGATIALRDDAPMAALLEALGYAARGEEPFGRGALRRFECAAAPRAGTIDLHVDPAAPDGAEGAGTAHHLAFRAADRAAQDEMAARLAALGVAHTAPIDREYFWAVYARTPSGVLVEIATDGPGFAVDEPAERLGESLRIPAGLSARAEEIRAGLPPARFD